MKRTFRALARLAANHCLHPGLRHWLLRRSGLTIGEQAFINMGLTVVDRYISGFVTIGARVSMAPNITLVTHSDPNESILKEQADLLKVAPITISDDSWIGAQVTILPGVTIGPRSIIGAGSVVTQDVPADSVYGGVPAQFIRTLGAAD